MTEDQTESLAHALEDGSLPPAQFGHASHVRAGWHYLRTRPFADAATHFQEILLAYVRRLNAQEKFHLTLTRALLHLIHARMTVPQESWEDFAVRNADLFGDAKGLINRHYSAEQLGRGRQQWAEPDRLPLP